MKIWLIYQKFVYSCEIILIIIRMDYQIKTRIRFKSEQSHNAFGVYLVIAICNVYGIVKAAGYSVELLHIVQRMKRYFYAFHKIAFFFDIVGIGTSPFVCDNNITFFVKVKYVLKFHAEKLKFLSK